MRFVRGLPQKLGGWVRAFAAVTLGVPRSLHAWRDLSSNQYLAAGTYQKLYVYDPGLAQNDITPFRSTGTLGNNPFTTTNGSATVTVVHTGHGLNFGDAVIYSGSAAVGGITPNGTFSVFNVIDANDYQFVFTSNATSGATGGGNAVAYEYEIPIGVELGTYGLGYGVGGYGLGTYGTARSGSTIYIEPRIWSLDHFGKLLLASYNGGGIYLFDPTASQPWGRATIVDASAPTNCRAMFVTPERFVMALLDNMQVAWCSQGDYTTWTPATNNTANIRTLTEGTKLVSGRVLANFVSLVWTDAAVYLFQYTGSAFIYNSSMIAKDCGLIAPGAAVTVNGVAYWMGQNNFFTYNGSVTPIPNSEDVRKAIFDLLDPSTSYQCTATYNPKFNEVWFSYTVTGQTSPTMTAIYQIDNQCFAPLQLGRTAGTHFTQGDTRPYMADSDGYIYQHENTNDANGAILPWSLTLAPYAMEEGKTHMDMEYLVMDLFEQSGAVSVTINTWDRLNDSAEEDMETETAIVTDSGTIDTRVSGRYLGFTLSCSALGSYFRYGRPVAFVKPSGDRS